MADQAETATPAASGAAKHATKAARVTLRTAQRYLTFQPGGDLPPVTYAGTQYTGTQADEVRTQAKKHGVRVLVVQPEED